MRVSQWDKLLSKYIEENVNSPHKLGSLDCLIFCANATKLITNIDVLEESDGYECLKDGARQVFKKRRSFEGIYDYYFQRTRSFFANRGDVVFRRNEGGFFWGLVGSGKVFVKIESNGYKITQIRDTDIVWRVI